MTSTIDWHARARSLEPDARPFIGEARVELEGGDTFAEHHPHDGRLVARVPECLPQPVDRAVDHARRAAQEGVWSARAPSQRAAVLHDFADRVAAHAQDLALLDSLEMGIPISLGVADLQEAAALAHATASLAESVDSPVLPSAPTTLAMACRVPHGVVAAITPWNFPVYVALSKVVPALAMGNSVVLKPSEVASLGCLRLADLAREAGVPPGVFQVVTGRGATTGRALALHPDVDCLSFTGSTATGQRLMGYAGESNLKALLLECGGKSPQIVFDDMADPEELDALAGELVHSFTWNAGQLCVAGTRILVARSLHEPLWQRMAEHVRALSTGDPLDPHTTIGPLASRTQLERVQAWVELAQRELLPMVRGQAWPGGCHLAPTLIREVPNGHRLMQEEIFGPVAGMVPFDDEAQALQLANQSRYGLQATVWTRDIARAQRLSRRLQAGTVLVNAAASPAPGLVSGAGAEPVKMSGFGAEGGRAGLLAYTRLRNVQFNLG